MADEMVEVVRSPEAPHLVGKRGVIVYQGKAEVCIEIGGSFTYLRKGDVQVGADLQKRPQTRPSISDTLA